jgi:tetratricopeptide (TPR) repeat protein
MIRFSDEFTYAEFDLSLKLSRMALQKSIAIKFPKGEIKALDAIAYTHKEHFNLDSAEFFAKKFLAKAKKYDFPEEQVTARMLLAGISYNRGDYAKAIRQNKDLLKLALKIKDHRGVSSIYNNIGLNYDETQRYDSAIHWYTKSLNYRLKYEKDKTIIAHNYLNIGVTYVNKGDFDEGVNFHYKAIKIFKEANEIIGVAKAYSNIGVIHSFSDDWKKALKSYQSALDIFEKMDDKRLIASTFMNIGTAYEHLGQIDTALNYYQKSLAIYIVEQDTFRTAQCYNNIGSIELIHKNYDNAIENFTNALDIKIKYY